MLLRGQLGNVGNRTIGLEFSLYSLIQSSTDTSGAAFLKEFSTLQIVTMFEYGYIEWSKLIPNMISLSTQTRARSIHNLMSASNAFSLWVYP